MSGDARVDGTGSGQPSRQAPRVGPPRRLFVIGGVAAALGVLTDHGLRLDLPQPPPPVPTRRRVPDEALLVSVVRDLDEMLSAWPRTGRPGARIARDLLEDQRRILFGRLTNQGVPTAEITVAATVAPRPTPTRLTPTALGTRLSLVTPDRWKAATSATSATRELMTAAYGTRLVCAGLLGRTIRLGAASPARADLGARTAPLVYAFEVVAAQSAGAQRERALETLAELRALDRELGQGSLPGGWSLPRPVTSGDEARALANEVLRTAVAGTVAALGADPSAATVEDVARWSARVQLVAHEWGLALDPFPGTDT